jgi:hypothetical protein
MAAVLYTSTAAIRAAIGVTAKELPDALFTDQSLALQMQTSLYAWIPTYATLYTAGTATGATASAQHIANLLTLYCLYFGAMRAIEMVMALRQKVTDGKQEVARFAVKWQELLEAMRVRLEEVTAMLDQVLTTSSGTVSYFGRAIPDYDPVANT